MSPRRAAHVRFPPPMVGLLAILAGVALHEMILPLPLGLGGRTIRLGAGAFCGLTGLLFIGLANLHFRRTGQNPKPWTPTPELIREGIYGLTRNPMYVGLALMQVAIGIAINNLWVVVMVLPALAIIDRIAVRPEEVYLERKFGKRYLRYRDRVRRWI